MDLYGSPRDSEFFPDEFLTMKEAKWTLQLGKVTPRAPAAREVRRATLGGALPPLD